MNKTWYAVSAIVVALAAFQLFLHYQYVHLSGGYVMRIDRLTGTSCIMPCVPSPPPAPTPTPTPFNGYQSAENYTLESERQDERAIVLAKGTSIAASIVATAGGGYTWTAETTDFSGSIFLDQAAKGKYQTNPLLPSVSLDDAKEWKEDPPPSLHSASFQTKLVCYCTAKGFGWRWEVHVDNGEVFYVNDNADLLKKYDLPHPTSHR